MEINCPSCHKLFNPWFSRDNGKPQSYPYKKCFSCNSGTPNATEDIKPVENEEFVILNQRLTEMGKFLSEQFREINKKLRVLERADDEIEMSG